MLRNRDRSVNLIVRLFIIARVYFRKTGVELCNTYLAKTVLTKFRQDNGYKEGRYIKLWGDDEVEDNKFLLRFIEEGVSPDDMYSKLEEAYKSFGYNKEWWEA